jgi:hypothetical protein
MIEKRLNLDVKGIENVEILVEMARKPLNKSYTTYITLVIDIDGEKDTQEILNKTMETWNRLRNNIELEIEEK